MITVYNQTFAIGEDESDCPDAFDPVTFRKTVETYIDIVEKTNDTPIVEYIFERVISHIEIATSKEVIKRVRKDLRSTPGVTEDRIKQIADQAAAEAVENMMDGLYEEIMSILKYKNFTYLSMSMRSSEGYSSINPAQLSVLIKHYKRGDDDEY